MASDEDILDEVLSERRRQDAKFGEQNHPDGTSVEHYTAGANVMRDLCQRRAKDGTVTWVDIANEEIWEGFAEQHPLKLRAELLQAAAVYVNWVGALDRRPPRLSTCPSCGRTQVGDPWSKTFQFRPEEETDLDWDGCSEGAGT